MKNLQELTGQESGIVIYNGDEAILCNWSNIAGMPKLFTTGLIGMGEEIEEIEPERINDISDLVGYVELIYSDMNPEQFKEEFKDPVPAKVYKFEDGTIVIAPMGWN